MSALPPFSVLVDAHGDELLAHARRVLGPAHPEAAEDVLQDALLRALRAYPRLRHADHLRAWLFRITTNAAMDAHRRRRREVPVAEPDTGADAPRRVGRERSVAAHTDPEALDGFEDLIAVLPETSRTPLRLRFVDDLEYEVIATRLDCSPAAARQRVSSAVRTLRQRITA